MTTVVMSNAGERPFDRDSSQGSRLLSLALVEASKDVPLTVHASCLNIHAEAYG